MNEANRLKSHRVAMKGYRTDRLGNHKSRWSSLTHEEGISGARTKIAVRLSIDYLVHANKERNMGYCGAATCIGILSG